MEMAEKTKPTPSVVAKVIEETSLIEKNSNTPLVVPTITDPSNAGKPELKGVSVHHLRHGLLKEVEMEEGLNQHSKIFEIENLENADTPGLIRRKGLKIHCPIFDGRIGAAYVHCLKGEDNVGDATHMLSYSWSYAIIDVIDTLEAFYAERSLDPKRTYIWICCLCNNQHKIIEDRRMNGQDVPPEEFRALFEARVVGIGRLVCMMSPWREPVYLTRVWCTYELFTAIQNSDCKVAIGMPRSEHDSMRDEIVTRGAGVNSLYEALSNTHVENAKASVESDRIMILSILRSGLSCTRVDDKDGDGYVEINRTINEYLRKWVRDSLTSLASDTKSKYDEGQMQFDVYAAICGNIGEVLRSNGEHSSALELHRTIIASSQGMLCEGVVDLTAARAYNDLGGVQLDLGRFGEALQNFQIALIVYEATKQDPKLVAGAINNIGLALKKIGRYDEALVQYRKACTLREEVCGKEHPHTAQSHNNLGMLLNEMGRRQDALLEHRKALAIREAVLVKDHPDIAISYNNIGLVSAADDHHEEALEAYRKALAIWLVSLGEDHSDTARAHHNIGMALCELGQCEEALIELRKALAGREIALGENHPATASTRNSIGFVLSTMDRQDEALVEYRKALAVREAAFGEHHPETAMSVSNFGSMLTEMGYYDEAVVYSRKACLLYERALGKDHPSTAIAYNNLGHLLFRMNHLEEAVSEMRKALLVWEVTLGEDHPKTRLCRENISGLLSRLGIVLQT